MPSSDAPQVFDLEETGEEKALYLQGAGHNQFIIFARYVNPENRDHHRLSYLHL